ncbi:bile acid:sodium symporter [Gemmata sp. JC673]|uniref:Bile acid:sodium symporter n=1 Tax=Gemmata algarum TaxID=2975278 RepID=A0ABU5EX06_9BACT|nr:bile acid:sodium symporter [Gemmata algarum]MDY3558164.1 bile acid:sodium symporter [Gemmata algarum]
MGVLEGPLARFAEVLHHRLLWLLVAVYALAGIAPAAGLWLRSADLHTVELLGSPVTASLPSILLSVLLFNAGLGVEPGRLRDLLGKSGLLLAALVANVALPLTFILAVSASLTLWHNPTEVQYILVGLALIASMPVAGSSTAWSQNANGDLALSLGLVVGSTVLSPLTTPAVLHAVGWAASGPFADTLHHLAASGTSSFLAAFVMAPSLAGILTRCLLGGGPVARAKSGLKVVNSVTLLVLCYANAAVALPKTFADPDWDFLTVMLMIVFGMCALGFVAGAGLSRVFGADPGRRASLMFGLGMTNNGTGLVLATTALAHVPEVMLPVIFYNLVQHVVAGFADSLNRPTDLAVAPGYAASEEGR